MTSSALLGVIKANRISSNSKLSLFALFTICIYYANLLCLWGCGEDMASLLGKLTESQMFPIISGASNLSIIPLDTSNDGIIILSITYYAHNN